MLIRGWFATWHMGSTLGMVSTRIGMYQMVLIERGHSDGAIPPGWKFFLLMQWNLPWELSKPVGGRAMETCRMRNPSVRHNCGGLDRHWSQASEHITGEAGDAAVQGIAPEWWWPVLRTISRRKCTHMCHWPSSWTVIYIESVKKAPGQDKQSSGKIQLLCQWDTDRIVRLTKPAIHIGKHPAVWMWASSVAICKPGKDDYVQLKANHSISL